MADGIKIDLRIANANEIQRKIGAVGDSRKQRAALTRAFKASARRVQARILENIRGRFLEERTGDLRDAFAKQKPKSATRRRGFIRIGIPWPVREDLKIEPDDPHYYPFAIEYGHKNAAPHPFIRSTVNELEEDELQRIGDDLLADVLSAFRNG